MSNNNGVNNNDDRKNKQPQLPINVGVNKKSNGQKKSEACDSDREWRMWGDIWKKITFFLTKQTQYDKSTIQPNNIGDTMNRHLTDMIIKYEMGELDDIEIIALFQELIDTGLAWRLQGSYGRAAKHLIDEGLCQPA